jgi:preprotein translocase subunit SecE
MKKGQNLPILINFQTYFQEVLRELKKVDWPSRDQTIKQTSLVLLVSAGIALYLGGIDYVFTRMLEFILK